MAYRISFLTKKKKRQETTNPSHNYPVEHKSKEFILLSITQRIKQQLTTCQTKWSSYDDHFMAHTSLHLIPLPQTTFIHHLSSPCINLLSYTNTYSRSRFAYSPFFIYYFQIKRNLTQEWLFFFFSHHKLSLQKLCRSLLVIISDQKFMKTG